MRLGLTINALEVRLYRARKLLRQALHGELRADAETFGLALDQEASMGWRETRQWCHLCGQRRLRGHFDSQSDGRVHLRLRCPDCSPRSCDMFASSQASVAGFHSFRSAYKHAWKADFTYWRQAVAQGRQVCLHCKNRIVPLQIVRPDELDIVTSFPNTYRTIVDCPTCGITGTCSIADLFVHPTVSRFVEMHPRWVIGPESASEYAGQPVIRTYLCDGSAPTARLIGIANIGFFVQLTTLLQTQTPDAYRGRIFGAYGMVWAFFLLLGTGLTGALGDRLHIVLLLNVEATLFFPAGALAFVFFGSAAAIASEPGQQADEVPAALP
jgi:hypothetical protein